MAQKELAVGETLVMAPTDVAHFTAATLTQYRIDVGGLPDPVRAFQIGVYIADPRSNAGPGVDANKAGQSFVVTTPYDGVKNIPKIGKSGDAYVAVLPASPSVDQLELTLTKRLQPQKWGLWQAIKSLFGSIFG